jgi:adenine-specific DNA-methyltransferase
VDKEKNLGQIFTPLTIVNEVLDEVEFTVDKIGLDTKILEPSFGEGVFLKEIISRIVSYAKALELSTEKTSSLIDRALWGVEYDKELFHASKSELIRWVNETYNLNVALPNLYNMDALDFQHYGIFDFVVGNPPYVRIHNLDDEMRAKVKQYAHSTGTTDLYIIFYELGIKWLNEKGKLAYIAPNSWLRNVSQSSFRKELVTKKLITKIIDFGTTKVFPKISTYTCIVVLDNEKQSTKISYEYRGSEEHYKTSTSLNTLFSTAGKPLIFMSKKNHEFIKLNQTGKTKQLSSICEIQNGLATLGDKYYIINDNAIKQYSLESESFLPVVKASRYKGEPITGKIIFPYKENTEKKIIGLTEEYIQSKLPNLFKYFTEKKLLLLDRSLDVNSLWFWYGRTQALQATYKKKLVFSPIIGPEQSSVKTFIVPAGTLVYSGLFVTEKENSSNSLEDVKKILESEEFCQYIKIHGKDMSGGYKSAGSKTIKEFLL